MKLHIIPLAFVISNLESVETEKIQKFKYLQNIKSFLDEKAFFVVSEGLSFSEKMKNSGHDLDVTSSKCKYPFHYGWMSCLKAEINYIYLSYYNQS